MLIGRSSGWRAVALCALVSALTAFNSALAASGGNTGCPYTSDAKLELGGKALLIPQEALTARAPTMIGDYEIVPDPKSLTLMLTGRKGDVWEASMTSVVAGKRCSAFYVGKPVLINPPKGH